MIHDIELIGLLVALIILSGFFSTAETGMMAINRYRLHHKAKMGNKNAKLVINLLQRQDRLLGVILIGNTFANICASAIGTIIAVDLFGEVGALLSTIVLTLIILIFAEVTPKTFAALQPMKSSFFVAWPLYILQFILYPIVWFANAITNGILAVFGMRRSKIIVDALSAEELRTVVHEAGSKISTHNQEMLLGILDLNTVTVEDIMIPKHEVIGLDLEDEWVDIARQLSSSMHTRLPVYEGSLENLRGMVHMRDVMRLLTQQQLTQELLLHLLYEPFYIPDTTPLNKALLNFQHGKHRHAIVVDEYGEVKGLVTLDDILEEVVGEFTTTMAAASPDIHRETDNSYIIDGSITLRELNRLLKLTLPTQGAKTLSGAITEYLETIPVPHSCLRLAGYPIEIIKIQDNIVKTVRVYPKLFNPLKNGN